jgi:hypothetical protein
MVQGFTTNLRITMNIPRRRVGKFGGMHRHHLYRTDVLKPERIVGHRTRGSITDRTIDIGRRYRRDGAKAITLIGYTEHTRRVCVRTTMGDDRHHSMYKHKSIRASSRVVLEEGGGVIFPE